MITPEYAASKLIVNKIHMVDGEYPMQLMVIDEAAQPGHGAVLEDITAYGPGGQVLHLMEYVDSLGRLHWIPEQGDWDLYIAWCGKTGQNVKRAAPGGEGYSLDHFSQKGVASYLNRFDQVIEDSIKVRSFFNDSYEVYGASWTPGLFEEFQKRRGYDLRTYIRELEDNKKSELAARVKCDYWQTLSEMLLENFTSPWTFWANEKGVMTKNQAHGSPANLIDLYAAVDIPECETYGHTRYKIEGLRQDSSDQMNVEPDPLMLKLATSAAHISGKQLISNETFTWLGEHFKVSLAQCKPEAEEAFVAGINHIFYHGTTYSPSDESWPGWLFYASVNFAPSNSFWPHLKGLNSYITRCQSMLQSGQPENELLVYWPVFDIWSNPSGLELQLSVHNIKEWLDYPAVTSMYKAGYNFDFISDQWLENSEISNGKIITSDQSLPYKAVIIPKCTYMPLGTLHRILELVERGATVIFQELPKDVPGLFEYASRKESMSALLNGIEFRENKEGIQEYRIGKGVILLSEIIENALVNYGIQPENINDYGLKYSKRSLSNGKIYFLVNHTPSPIDTIVPINHNAESVVIMDPQNGNHGLARIEPNKEQTNVRVQLASGESLILRTFEDDTPSLAPWEYFRIAGHSVELAGEWTLDFADGTPIATGPIQLNRLQTWTDLDDTIMLHYSGTGIYSTFFEITDLQADEYLLDLGTVYESAKVWLNGRDLGIFYSNPFSAKAGHLLKEGINEITIEVANLMANRIRFLDQNRYNWKKFLDINFVNIQYEPFDASGWKPMKSGLEGPVRLIPMMQQ